MTSDYGRDNWNRHRWPRDTSWWDDLEISMDDIADRGESVFDWLDTTAPDPYEHDFILYTDGSGCTAGWGGYAAVYERVDLTDDGFRGPVGQGVVLAGTYGSTVARSELNAFLDGIHRILSDVCDSLQERAAAEPEFGYKVGTEGMLNQLAGPDRLRVLWYTDRENLAKSLLFDVSGEPLAARKKDRDLWMRWSFMARHICLTPMCRPRNTVRGQEICDSLAGIARQSLRDSVGKLSEATRTLYSSDKWLRQKYQTAQF